MSLRLRRHHIAQRRGGSSQGFWVLADHPLFVARVTPETRDYRSEDQGSWRIRAYANTQLAASRGETGWRLLRQARSWGRECGLIQARFATRREALAELERLLSANPPPWTQAIR